MDIRRFLFIPHTVQELVSAEKTPTLSIVLPVYERLIIMLKNLRQELPQLAHAITASINKLEEYLAISQRTKIYALAMGEFFVAVQSSRHMLTESGLHFKFSIQRSSSNG